MKTNTKTRFEAWWLDRPSASMASRILTVAMLTLCTASTSLAADEKALRKNAERGTIVGRVLAFQNPSLGPEVKVESFELFIGNDRFKSDEVTVDEEGRFVFKDVPAGRVRLQPTFSADSVQEIRLPSTMIFSTMVRPGQTREVTLFGKGQPVKGQILVPPGIDAKKLRVQFVLVAPPVRALLGPSGNKPTALAHVYERLRKEVGDLSSSLDEHGRFQIEGVREGSYWINVTNLGFARKETPGYPSIEGGKLNIELMASGALDDPLDLGALRFTRPVRAAQCQATRCIQASIVNARATFLRSLLMDDTGPRLAR
jgi:hypothetical protein